MALAEVLQRAQELQDRLEQLERLAVLVRRELQEVLVALDQLVSEGQQDLQEQMERQGLPDQSDPPEPEELPDPLDHPDLQEPPEPLDPEARKG